MRTTLCLIALSVVLAGCSHNGEPSATQIEFALNKAVKAKNPDAVAKVTSVDCKSPYFDEQFKFSCTNCVMEFKDGERHLVPSSEGSGIVRLDGHIHKWNFDRIILESPGIGRVVYESDFIF